MTPLVAALHKLASGFTTATPDYQVDSQQVALKEHQENLKDNRATLGELFRQAGAAEKAETSLVNKLLPKVKGADRESGSPMVKLAQEVFVRAFVDELEKLGGAPTMRGPKAVKPTAGVSKSLAARL